MDEPEPPTLGWMIYFGTSISLVVMIAVSLVDKFVIRGESASAGYFQALIVTAALTGIGTATLIVAAVRAAGYGRR